jgi:hypothetical protein
MILNNKQIDVAYRMGDILINPYLRSLSKNIGAPSEKGRQLRWIIPLIIIFVIAVINIMVNIY